MIKNRASCYSYNHVRDCSEFYSPHSAILDILLPRYIGEGWAKPMYLLSKRGEREIFCLKTILRWPLKRSPGRTWFSLEYRLLRDSRHTFAIRLKFQKLLASSRFHLSTVLRRPLTRSPKVLARLLRFHLRNLA